MMAWSDWAARWLLDYYAAASVALAVVAIASAMVRAAAARMALWRAALVGLALLAMLCAAPGWPRFAVARRASSLSASAHLVAASHRWASSLPDSAFPDRHSERPSDIGKSNPRCPTGPSHSPTTRRADAIAKGPTTLRLADAAPWIVAFFLLGAGVLLARLLWGAIEVRRLCRRASVAPEAAISELKRIAGGAGRLPRLLVSPSISMAAACGLLRPTIVLPERALNAGLALRPILAHEWAHIRRGDLWLLALLRGVQIALFAHPLFWLLRWRIRRDQELIADATAAECCGRCEYAEALVAWARFQATQRVGAYGMVGIWESRTLLTRRISMLLDERIRLPLSCSRRWKLGSGIASLTLVAALSLFTLRPELATFAAPPTESKKAVPNATAKSEKASRPSEPPGAAEQASISGVCFDENHQPLAGAHVRAFRMERSDQMHQVPTGGQKLVRSFLADVTADGSSGGYGSSVFSPDSQRVLAEAATDASGHFQLAGLDADEAWTRQDAIVLVVVQAPGKGTQYDRAMLGRGSDGLLFVKRTNFVLPRMDFVLPPAESLRGRIVDAAGKPVAGAVVSCPDACSMAKPLPGIMCAVTDLEGRFEIGDLPPFDVADLPPQVSDIGVWAATSAAVGIEHPEYAPQVAQYVRLPAVVEVVLHRPAALAGQVVDEESGQPDAKATVYWIHERGFSGSMPTDENGRYAATGLPPGKYTLKCWRPDCLVMEREIVLHSGDQSADLRLERGALIHGVVIDEATGKAPLSIGGMQMFVNAMLPGEEPKGQPVQADGTFSMTVRPGKNSLLFFHPRWRLLDEARWHETGVEAVRGQTVEVTLHVVSQRPEWAATAGDGDAPPTAAFALPETRLSGKALVELLESAEYIHLERETIDGREVVTRLGCGLPYEFGSEVMAPQLAWIYENLLANIGEFAELRELMLYPPRGCDKALESLGELKKLKSLVLVDASDLTVAGVAHLGAMPNLKQLGVTGPCLDDQVLREIARLPKLEWLMIGGALTDEGLEQLRGNVGLKTLYVEAMPGANLTDRGLKSLAELTSLNELALGQTDEDGPSHWNITDAGLRSLAALNNLESLSLLGEKMTDAGLVYLRGLTKLKQLELRSSAVTEAGIAELKQALPNLIVKGFGDMGVDKARVAPTAAVGVDP